MILIYTYEEKLIIFTKILTISVPPDPRDASRERMRRSSEGRYPYDEYDRPPRRRPPPPE